MLVIKVILESDPPQWACGVGLAWGGGGVSYDKEKFPPPFLSLSHTGLAVGVLTWTELCTASCSLYFYKLYISQRSLSRGYRQLMAVENMGIIFLGTWSSDGIGYPILCRHPQTHTHMSNSKGTQHFALQMYIYIYSIYYIYIIYIAIIKI